MPATTTVKDYIDALPDDRKKFVSELRKTINKQLPKGFKESIGYNMLIWSVPHSIFPDGYHCDPSKPLMLIGLSATKGGVSLHHLGLYGSAPLTNWFQSEWSKRAPKKLDMGKGCMRFKKIEDVPLDLVGELASKLTPRQWVEEYQKLLSMRPTK